MSAIGDLFAELQRRSVIRAGVAHVIFFWVLAQVADVVLPYVGIVENPVRWAVVAGAALFPCTLILAWFFEHPWKSFTRSRLAIDLIVIGIIAVLTGSWAIRNLPQLVQTKTSIVILPFQHSDQPPEQTISRALAYEVNSLLMRSKSIDVIGFETATSDTLAGLGSIGVADRLNVAHILTGSLTVKNGDMSLIVELLDAAGQAIWEGEIEDDIDNLFAVQERLASEVESRLGAGGDRIPMQSVVKGRCWIPGDTEAMEKYYTARYYVELRNSSERARELLREAIRLYLALVEQHPKFAEAKSGLAWALAHQMAYDDENALPPAELDQRMEQLAREALAECPTLGEALHILPNQFSYPNAWIHQHRQLTAFLEMQPDRTEYYQRLSSHYRQTGLTHKAVDIAERNYALNPLSVKAITILAAVYQYAGRFDEAIELEDKATELGSGSPGFARMMKQLSDCMEDLECALENLPPPFQPYKEELREIYSEPADDAEVRAKIDLALRMHREAGPGGEKSMWTNWFNGSAGSFDHLGPLFYELWEQNKTEGGYWFHPNNWSPPIMNASEFSDWADEVGFTEYWNEVGFPEHCEADAEGVVCKVPSP